MPEYHPSQETPPLGSAIFHIELKKSDVTRLNWLRKNYEDKYEKRIFKGKTNYEILKYLLDKFYIEEYKAYSRHYCYDD